MGLMNQVVEGEIVLPAIQRDFVWTEEQTERLLDSVMRGYPVGLLLLWEMYNDIQFRPFIRDFKSGNLHAYRENPERRRLRLVLDGQQRLQSLYIALYGQRDGRVLCFDVLSGQREDDAEDERYLFDFKTLTNVGKDNRKEEETAEPAAQREYLPTWWVPVRELFTMGPRERRSLVRDLTSKLRLDEEDGLLLEDNLAAFDHELTRDENILRVSTIDENLPSDSPSRKTESDVLEIFVRTNREGTELIRSDLIFSMLKLNWKESAEGLPEFVHSVNEGNSFGLDTDFVVRCLFAVSGLGGRLEVDLLRKQSNVARLQGNFDRCCDAIRATVDFVRQECNCESSRLLGSSATLVPITYYLFCLPRHDVPNDQVDRLRTAIYLFGLARPFSRYGESRVGAFVRSDLQTLADADDRAFPLEGAINWVRRWEPTIGSIDDLAESNHDLALHLIQGLSGAHV